MDTIVKRRMSAIFNEWARRYSEAPGTFSNILGADGKPVANYGDSCVIYFHRIAGEMDANGKLPVLPLYL